MQTYSIPILSMIGLSGLITYLVIDFIKNKGNQLLRRVIMYSFIFYLVMVSHYTIGSFEFPPHNGFLRVQWVPFMFISDWIYARNMGEWFFWNSVKLTFYNLLLLMPLGLYLGLLFQIKQLKKVTIIVFIVSFSIELCQLVFSSLGFLVTIRTFNVDDLMLNTLGGAIGFLLWLVMRKWLPSKWEGKLVKEKD